MYEITLLGLGSARAGIQLLHARVLVWLERGEAAKQGYVVCSKALCRIGITRYSASCGGGAGAVVGAPQPPVGRIVAGKQEYGIKASVAPYV